MHHKKQMISAIQVCKLRTFWLQLGVRLKSPCMWARSANSIDSVLFPVSPASLHACNLGFPELGQSYAQTWGICFILSRLTWEPPATSDPSADQRDVEAGKDRERR